MIEVQVYCITEQKYVVGYFDDVSSVRCPNNKEHAIDPNSISILKQYTPLGLPIDTKGRLRVVNTSCSCSDVFTYYTSISDDKLNSLSCVIDGSSTQVSTYIDFNNDVEVLSGTLTYSNLHPLDKITFRVVVPATEVEPWVTGVKLKLQQFSPDIYMIVKASEEETDNIYQIKQNTIPYPVESFDIKTWAPTGLWTRPMLPNTYDISAYTFIGSNAPYVFLTQPITLYTFINSISLANKTGSITFMSESGFRCLKGWRLVMDVISGTTNRTEPAHLTAMVRIARKDIVL